MTRGWAKIGEPLAEDRLSANVPRSARISREKEPITRISARVAAETADRRPPYEPLGDRFGAIADQGAVEVGIQAAAGHQILMPAALHHPPVVEKGI